MERKKMNRINRERNLTAAEVASDEAIRNKVTTEFPPVNLAARELGGFSEALRSAIQASPKSVYQICKETGISQIVVSRFLAGERDIRLATADRLAKVLGIEVVSHQ